MGRSRDWGAAVADLILGRCCAGCDRPGRNLCVDCSAALRPRVRLQTRLRLDDVAPGVGVPVITPLDYAGAGRQILYRFKDHADLSLTRPLAIALAAALTDAGASDDGAARIAIPVPSRRVARRTRGFTPIDRVLEQAIHLGALPLRIHRCLLDSRVTGADKSLGGADRQASAAGAFHVRGAPPTGAAILVDDVVTTGATLREAAATLMHAGVHLTAAVALAGTPSVGVRRR